MATNDWTGRFSRFVSSVNVKEEEDCFKKQELTILKVHSKSLYTNYLFLINNLGHFYYINTQARNKMLN